MKIKQSAHKTKKPNYQSAIIAGIAAVLVVVAVANIVRMIDRNSSTDSRAETSGNSSATSTIDDAAHVVTPLPAALASNNSTTASQLIYLIEEEKLAHDVYQKMSELWGSRVFSNIKRSEVNHQDQLFAVMQSRGILDPRSNKVGIFTSQKLQTLYDQLIAQGSQSVWDAYKVGVVIEELDIADIKTDLSSLDPKGSDVKITMENLLRGSENHLSSFSRQVQR